jgi:hypothetical protein
VYRRIEVPIYGKSAMTLAARAMVESGLPDPGRKFRVPWWGRYEFFFTEYGWRKCGHKILSEIRSQGVIAKVIAVKENDPRIKVLYSDKWQVTIHWGGRREREFGTNRNPRLYAKGQHPEAARARRRKRKADREEREDIELREYIEAIERRL